MKSITTQFEESVKLFPNNTYLWEKKTDSYKPMTYSEVREQVYLFAAGLMNLGINKGDRLALLSESRNEWVIGELGIMYVGAVNVPLSVKLNEPSELIYRLNHSGARMILVSQGQAKKIRPILSQLTTIEKIIIFDQQDTVSENELYFYNVSKQGEDFLKTKQSEFQTRWQSVQPSDYATISYTSGTTADPKGIILTHRNYTANVEQSLSLMDVPEHFVTLIILPWDHAFAHTCGIYTVMKTGAAIASVQSGKTPMETLKNIGLSIKETKPHFIMSVPALAKNFKKNIESGIAAKGSVVKALFNFGLKVGYLYNGIGWDKGKGWRILLKPVCALMNKIIFSKVRENFGGRMEFFVGGGALLDIELQRFFYAIGIPMMQGYGLTEATPVISSNSLKKHKLGSSGALVHFMELKICDNNGNEVPVGEKGEIVIRGENVMAGYWNNSEATQETIIDNWLHTGDMGYMDKDGFLYVLGRFKSLLIADDGEKYSPEGIEEALVAESPFIDQCMLYNNQNPYTVALIVPNKEAIKRWLNEKNHHYHHQKIKADDESGLALKLIECEINEFRIGKKHGQFPQRWLPAAIAILDEPFTEENQMINSTMKLVRGKVIDRYNERIKYLYTPDAKNVCNSQNKQALFNLIK
jgi:long-chain acyl-CoA synthetase